MTRDPGSAPLHRCVAVWVLVSGGLGVLGGWVTPDLTVAATVTARGHLVAFDQALVWLCEGVLLACASWLWVVTGIVTTDAARGRAGARVGVPAPVRHALLLACGVALTTSLAHPAHAGPGPAPGERATPHTSVQGLPLPDRATTAGHVGLLLARQVRAAHHRGHLDGSLSAVQPGDSLWSLAADTLPAGADDRAITRRWLQIYRANRQVIGPDPDLIHPDQQLRLRRP